MTTDLRSPVSTAIHIVKYLETEHSATNGEYMYRHP